MTLPIEDLEPEEPSGELVHWMTPGQFRVGPAAIAVLVSAAFAVGVAAALGALAAGRWIGPRRDGLPPWKWTRGPMH